MVLSLVKIFVQKFVVMEEELEKRNVTMGMFMEATDVMKYARWNHYIDAKVDRQILVILFVEMANGI